MRSFLTLSVSLCLTLLCCANLIADDRPAPLKVDSVLVTLIEQVEIPSQEAGVLTRLNVREGSLVRTQELLAQVDDSEARLVESKTRGELQIARSEAANDLKVRIAQKAYEVAQTELKRARESITTYPKSVSATELDRLTLTADKTAFEVDQAKHDREIARLTQGLKENEVQQAQRKIVRRQVLAPRDGMIVQIHRQPGEWVEPGEKVLRLVRLDRLRVEGFLNGKAAGNRLAGSRVQLMVELPGKPQTTFEGAVTFVSPEINPINGQVRVWAEIDNRNLQLRPGMRGTLILSP